MYVREFKKSVTFILHEPPEAKTVLLLLLCGKEDNDSSLASHLSYFTQTTKQEKHFAHNSGRLRDASRFSV